jgi:hypothetical protein
VTAREVARAARRLADRNTDRLRDQPRELFLAQVSAISAGVTTVQWRGSDVTAAGKNAAYSPSVGDWVLCALVQNRAFVICAINGQP